MAVPSHSVFPSPGAKCQGERILSLGVRQSQRKPPVLCLLIIIKDQHVGHDVHVCLLEQIQDYPNNVTLSLFFWVGLKGQQSQPAHGEFDVMLRRVSGTGDGHAHGSRPGSMFAGGGCCLSVVWGSVTGPHLAQPQSWPRDLGLANQGTPSPHPQ